jgi:hypothetical protein
MKVGRRLVSKAILSGLNYGHQIVTTPDSKWVELQIFQIHKSVETYRSTNTPSGTPILRGTWIVSHRAMRITRSQSRGITLTFFYRMTESCRSNNAGCACYIIPHNSRLSIDDAWRPHSCLDSSVLAMVTGLGDRCGVDDVGRPYTSVTFRLFHDSTVRPGSLANYGICCGREVDDRWLPQAG